MGWFAALISLGAAGVARAAMPPEAQTAVNRGIKAAKQEHDYLLATRYFQEARALVPSPSDAPEILLNLGLAESQVPGRELRAICWLSAFLAVDPNARAVGAVKDRIDELEVRSKSNLLRLVRLAQEAASQTSSDKRDTNLQAVAVNEAMGAGNAAMAMKIASLIKGEGCKIESQGYISDIQATNGDYAGAYQTAASIQYPAGAKEKWLNIRVIVSEEAVAGQFDWAVKTSELQEPGRNKSFTQAVIAETQAKAGEIAGAQKTAGLIQDPDLAAESLVAVFQVQMKGGATADAKATLATVLELAGRIENPDQRGRIQSMLAKAQAEAGDIAGALQTANLNQEVPPDGDWRSLARHAVAEAQARAGDYSGAQATADSIEDAGWKSAAESTIAQGRAGTLAGPAPDPVAPAVKTVAVSDWLDRLDDGGPARTCALNTPPFLDLAVCLKSLPASTDPQKSFDALAEVVGKVVAAQTTLDQMLRDAARQASARTREDSAKKEAQASAPTEDPKP
jgi:tetratricopeptide (TPR) repeat protein